MVRRVGKERKNTKKRVGFHKKTSQVFYDITYPTFLKIDSLLPVHTNTPSFDITNTPNPQKTSQLSKNESGAQKKRVSYFMTSQTPLFRKPIHFYLWAQDPIL